MPIPYETMTTISVMDERCKENGMKRLFLILSTLIWCSGAFAANVTFTDVSDLIEANHSNAATVAWGDFDHDGLVDLLIADAGTKGSQIYLNGRYGFTNPNASFDVSHLVRLRTAQLIDFDNDGRLDIFCLTNDEFGARLYRQTESRRFQEVNLLPVVEHGMTIRSAVWTDINGDGWLDILLSNTREEPYLTSLRQEDNQFIEERGGSELPPNLINVGAICLIDFDNDYDLDIFLGARLRTPSRLLRNDDGRYHSWGEVANLSKPCGLTAAAWMDYNNDQYLDLVSSGQSGQSFLMESEPYDESRIFTDQEGMPGFMDGMNSSKYVCPADFNADGWQDLLVVCTNTRDPKIMFNIQGQSWTIQPIVAPEWRERSMVTNACALADYDADGDIDIALASGQDGVRLLRNDTEIVQEWIGIKLVNTLNLSPVLDAQLLMSFQNCKRVGTTSAAVSSPGGDSPTIMFRSTDPDKSEEVTLTVHWPNGILRDYTLADLELNKVNKLILPDDDTIHLSTFLPPQDAVVRVSNAPNPFNPTTTINFELSEYGNVRLAVYDVLGREVVLLADAPYEAGAHALTFNAADLPTGLYFARLSALGQTKLHRMLLVK